VDKPLSQERLSEEDIKRYEEFYDMPNSDGYAVTVKKLLREVKRLQAMEEVMREIAKGRQDRGSLLARKYFEGVNDHEK
jgi:hypothetical protein